jgi:hypothetical protein
MLLENLKPQEAVLLVVHFNDHWIDESKELGVDLAKCDQLPLNKVVAETLK